MGELLGYSTNNNMVSEMSIHLLPCMYLQFHKRVSLSFNVSTQSLDPLDKTLGGRCIRHKIHTSFRPTKPQIVPY